MHLHVVTVVRIIFYAAHSFLQLVDEMDGSSTSQAPLSSRNIPVMESDNWPLSRKRRSRKPQETFRRQNTDGEDVMSDLIEYGGQLENPAIGFSSVPAASRAMSSLTM